MRNDSTMQPLCHDWYGIHVATIKQWIYSQSAVRTDVVLGDGGKTIFLLYPISRDDKYRRVRCRRFQIFSFSILFITREDKLILGHVVERYKFFSLMSCNQSYMRNAWCTSTTFNMASKNDKGTYDLNKHEISLIDANNKLQTQEEFCQTNKSN